MGLMMVNDGENSDENHEMGVSTVMEMDGLQWIIL